MLKYGIYIVASVIFYWATRYITVGDNEINQASYWFGFLYAAFCSIAFGAIREFSK